MATHSSILAWRIPSDRGAWQATVHAFARVRHDLATRERETERETERERETETEREILKIKASILQCSAFLIVQLSHPYITSGKPQLFFQGACIF